MCSLSKLLSSKMSISIGGLLLIAASVLHNGITLKCYNCHFAWKEPADDGQSFTEKYYDPATYHKECISRKPPQKFLHDCPDDPKRKTSEYSSYCTTHFVFGPVEGILRDCETVSLKHIAVGRNKEHGALQMNLCGNSTKVPAGGLRETLCKCNNTDGCFGDGTGDATDLKSKNNSWMFTFINVFLQLILLKIIL